MELRLRDGPDRGRAAAQMAADLRRVQPRTGALEVERRIEAKDVIRILDQAVAARGCVPEFIRRDNGPEFVALAVQDCIKRRGFATL